MPRQKLVWILIGPTAQLMFAATFWTMFWFLAAGHVGTRGTAMDHALLTLQFAVMHSWLLYPRTRDWLEHISRVRRTVVSLRSWSARACC